MRKGLALVLIWLLAALVMPAALAAPATVLGGTVTDEAGRPVAGAEVEAYLLGTGLKAVLTTDARGAYRLDGPVTESSLWLLRARAVGHRAAETGWLNWTQQRYVPLKLERISGELHLSVRDADGSIVPATALLVRKSGELVREYSLTGGLLTIPDLPAGDYRVTVLAPGFGPVTRNFTVTAGRTSAVATTLERSGFAVSGELRDALTGGPVTGAAVELLREDQSLAAAGATDHDGRFSLSLPKGAPGTYRLRASAQGYRGAITQGVAITAGQAKDWSGSDAIALQPIAATVVGTLLRDNGDYMPDMPVYLELRGYGRLAETTASLKGEFRFENVPVSPTAQFRLVAGRDNFVAEGGWTTLHAGSVNQVVLQAKPGFRWSSGTGSVSAVVVSGSGAPVAGVKVELVSRGAVLYTATTDATGTFLLEIVNGSSPMSPYNIRASKDGFFTTTELTVGGQTGTEFHVNGQARTIIRIVMQPARTTARGRVTDGQGTPLAGASVRLALDGEEYTAETTTDARGWYEFRDAPVRPVGRYLLRVEARGFQTVSGLDVTSDVLAGRPLVTTRLNATTAFLAGQLTGMTGAPLAGVAVTLRGPEGDVLGSASTDADGRYRIRWALSLVAGPMTVTAAREGWAGMVAEAPGAVAGGSVTTRDLVLAPVTGTVEGRVLDPDGGPASGMRVDLVAEGEETVQTAVTDAYGNYTFPNQPPGRTGWYWIRVRPFVGTFTGSLTHRTEVVPLMRLNPGERQTVDLQVNLRPPR